MEFDYMEEYLLSDLLILYKSTNRKEYLDEIKNRMFFCGFTSQEISEFIKFEEGIIKYKEKNYTKKIINKFYIIGKKENEYIFYKPDKYMFNPDSNNKNTLMISELLSIIDEAIFLTYSNHINSYNSKKEIKLLAQENINNWAFFEFKNRIEYICRCANNIINGPKTILYGEKTNILYDNEMQICIRRWKNIDVSSKNFVPYTYQYFD